MDPDEEYGYDPIPKGIPGLGRFLGRFFSCAKGGKEGFVGYPR